MYRLVVEIGEDRLATQVFKVLEREVRFARGRLYVKNGKIVAEAADASSLRSLLHTIFRVLYIVANVAAL